MATTISEVELLVNPVFDVQAFNAIMKSVKASLGDLGGDIQFIDEDELNSVLRGVEDQFKKVEKTIDETFDETQVTGFRKHLDNLKGGLKELAGFSGGDGAKGLFNIEAAERFTGLLEGASEKAKANQEAMRQLSRLTKAQGDELTHLRDIAADAFKLGGFESFDEAIVRLGVTKRAVGDAFSDEGLKVFSSGMKGVADIVDLDVNEAIKKGSNFAKAFGLDGKESLDLISYGAQNTATSQEDFLDVLAEMSPHFQEAGFSAQEMIGILVKGGEEAAFNLDYIANAAKETKIRLDDGSIEADLSGLGDEIPAELKRSISAGLEKAKDGKIGIADFLTQATKDINESGLSDSLQRKMFAVVSGTPAEEVGKELYSKVFSADIDADAITAQAALAGEQIQQTLAPTSAFEEFSLLLESTYGSAAGFIGPALGPATQFLQITTQMGPALQILKFGELAKDAGQFGLKILQSIVPSLVKQTVATGAVAAAQGAQAASTGAATGSMLALNAAMLANPVFLIATGVVALTGVLAALAFGGESVEEALDGVNEAMAETEKTISAGNATIQQANSLKELANEYERLKDKTDPESQRRMQEVLAQIAARAPETVTGIEHIGKSAEDMAGKVSVSTDALHAMADSDIATASAQSEAAIAKLGLETKDLVDATADARDEVQDLNKEKEVLLGRLEQVKGRTDAWSESYRKGIIEDLQEVQVELGEQEALVKQGDKAIAQTVKTMQAAGKSQKEIAAETDLTVAEVQRYQREMKDAEAQAEAATRAAEAMKSETEKIADAAANAAAQWQTLTSQTQKGLKEANAAGASLLLKQRQGLALSEEEKKNLSDFKEQAKETFAQTKAQQEAEKAFQRETGQIKETARKKSTKAQKTEFELAQQQFKLDGERIDLAEREAEISRETSRLLAGREETVFDELAAEKAKLETLHEQAAALRAALGIAEGQELTAANISIALSDKKGEPFEAEQMIRDLNSDIAEQENAVRAVQMSVELEFDEDQIRTLQEQQLQLRIELGLDEDASFTEAVIADIARLEQLYDDTTSKEIDRITELYNAKLLGETEYQSARSRLESGQTAEQLSIQNTIFERKRTIRDREFELEQQLLERRQAQEISALEEVASETIAIRERIADTILGIEGKRIDRDADRQLRRLEFQKEQELITEERYEQQKEKIARDGAARRSQLEARFRGAELEAQRQADVNSLALQEQHLSEQIGQLIAANKFAEADALGEQLDSVRDQIKQKGSLITGVMGDLQGEFGELAVSLFSFDKEGAKEPFRAFFGILGGALEQLAAAKATEVILGLISGVGGIPGLILSFAAKPVVNAVIGRFLSPILDGLLSFASGGRIDSPALFVAGDGSNLGGPNREWIFRDDQLRDVIRLVVAEQNSGLLEEVRGLRQDVQQLQFRLYVRGKDIATAVGRTNASARSRIINQYALAA